MSPRRRPSGRPPSEQSAGPTSGRVKCGHDEVAGKEGSGAARRCEPSRDWRYSYRGVPTKGGVKWSRVFVQSVLISRYEEQWSSTVVEGTGGPI